MFIYIFIKWIFNVKMQIFTYKEGADFLPAGYTSLFGVLPQRCLKQKQGDAAGEEEEYVRDEEYT